MTKNASKVFRVGNKPTLPEELATKQYVDDSSGNVVNTTKGDVFGFDSENKRIPVGSNDQVLTADSAQALGLKWATPTGASKTFAKVVTISRSAGTCSPSFLFLLKKR